MCPVWFLGPFEAIWGSLISLFLPIYIYIYLPEGRLVRSLRGAAGIRCGKAAVNSFQSLRSARNSAWTTDDSSVTHWSSLSEALYMERELMVANICNIFAERNRLLRLNSDVALTKPLKRSLATWPKVQIASTPSGWRYLCHERFVTIEWTYLRSFGRANGKIRYYVIFTSIDDKFPGNMNFDTRYDI